MKISLLIISMNNSTKTIELVKSVYTIGDEIVLIDSSNTSEHKKLVDSKTALKLSKLKIFYLCPLGYVEPFRMYGVSKCVNEWILYLDDDEVINQELMTDIDSILDAEGENFDAFSISRQTFVDGKISTKEYGLRVPKGDYQIRLYRKSKVKYSGIVHEQPSINGIIQFDLRPRNKRILKLNKKYKIMHEHDDKGSLEKFIKYMKLEVFQKRDSYSDTLKYIPGPLAGLLFIYLKLKKKNISDELTAFDYNLRQRVHYFLETKNIFRLIMPLGIYYTTKLAIISKMPDDLRKITFNIAQIISKANGVIHYLNLDSPERIEEFSREHQISEEEPVDLLNNLIIEKALEGSDIKLEEITQPVYELIIKFSKDVEGELS